MEGREKDKEGLSEKNELENMFIGTFQIKKCNTCNYFWLFTNFHPSTDYLIVDGVCNIAYPCFPERNRLKWGKQIRNDLDFAVAHFNRYYTKAPQLFDFNEIKIVCIDTETEDQLMEYKMEWNKEKECLEVTNESYSDSEIKEGMKSW